MTLLIMYFSVLPVLSPSQDEIKTWDFNSKCKIYTSKRLLRTE